MKKNRPKRMRVKNGIAKALHHPSFKQQVVPNKKHDRESKQRYQKALIDKESGQD